jgi:3-dehydroquinate synthase
VPTTLLAMVDSSVGGKTGVNLAAGKNLAGAFYQPRGVFVSTSLLKTLPAREFAAGTAEILKTGLLGDAALFAQLESKPLQPGDSRLPEIIKRCCAIKAGIVEADERELAKEGGRALLNLGHTFGHAIEQATGYAVYLHGEAVAIGLVAAAKLSQELDLISADDAARVAAAVKAHGLPVKLKAKLPLAELMEAAARDKKVRAGQRRFVVLQAVGTAIIRAEIDPARVEAGFRAVGAA